MTLIRLLLLQMSDLGQHCLSRQLVSKILEHFTVYLCQRMQGLYLGSILFYFMLVMYLLCGFRFKPPILRIGSAKEKRTIYYHCSSKFVHIQGLIKDLWKGDSYE